MIITVAWKRWQRSHVLVVEVVVRVCVVYVLCNK